MAVHSITFTGKKGYLCEKYRKPKKVDFNNKYIRQCDKDAYVRELDEWKTYGNTYKLPVAAKLLKRKIVFSTDKINVIFGQNGSGKTTILSALAALCNSKDGWPMPLEPLSISAPFGYDAYTKEDIKNTLDEKQENSCDVEWDGAPIYRHNFESRRGTIAGSLLGSIFSNLGEEISYIVDKKQMNSASVNGYIIYKLVEQMKMHLSFKDVFEPLIKKPVNSCWMNCYRAQNEYWSQFESYGKTNVQNTFLFDEIDKSFDILNMFDLYTKTLPYIAEKTGQQIIVVSHSPIAISDEVYLNDKYNFISIDEKYTKQCRELLGGIFSGK